MQVAASLSARSKAFLDFCRIEKGLAGTSVEAYRLDLERFTRFSVSEKIDQPDDPNLVRGYIDSLYQAGLASRSIARHITTLRNFYRFLLEQGLIDSDPATLLVLPKQWQSLPKYLNIQQVNDVLAAANPGERTGLPDRAVPEP